MAAKAKEKDETPKLTSLEIPMPDLVGQIIDPGPKKRYLLGVLSSFPIQNVTIGGQTFPRFSGLSTFDMNGDAEDPRALQRGGWAWLAEPELDHLVQTVSRYVVRRFGNRRVELHEALRPNGELNEFGFPGFEPDPRYRARHGDEPLGRYVYILPCDDESGLEYGARDFGGPVPEPEPLIRDKGEADSGKEAEADSAPAKPPATEEKVGRGV